jgi:hypothetical protein
MPRVGFELTIQIFAWTETFRTLYEAIIVISYVQLLMVQIHCLNANRITGILFVFPLNIQYVYVEKLFKQKNGNKIRPTFCSVHQFFLIVHISNILDSCAVEVTVNTRTESNLPEII